MRIVGLILLVSAGLACGKGAAPSPGHSIAAKEFDQSCADVVDCFPIYEGVVSCCSTQPCPNAAIRQDNVAAYMAEVAARMPACTAPVTPGTCRPLPACTSERVACAHGVCALESPAGDAATD